MTSSSVSTVTSVEAMLKPQLKPPLQKAKFDRKNDDCHHHHGHHHHQPHLHQLNHDDLHYILEHQGRTGPTLRTAHHLVLLERARHLASMNTMTMTMTLYSLKEHGT